METAVTDVAEEVEQLLQAVISQLIPFIRSSMPVYAGGANHLVDPLALDPHTLTNLLHEDAALPAKGQGQEGLLRVLEKVLKYSVNTWNEGFMDKLFASTNAPGVATDLILSVLNASAHTFRVSPVLTIIEKFTTRQFANLFGFDDVHSGGITLPSGSYSNITSMVIARNTLYPSTKTKGNGNYRFAVFTSAHGHYSVEKAATTCGLGSESVWQIAVDNEGKMIISELEEAILRAKHEGYTPFYVSATAGTTVLGSYDPLVQIGQLCQKHGLWFHVDGSWGGSVAFSEKHKYKLIGAEMADSLTVNPHKMLGVPVPCSFLLTNDTRVFHKANTLRAGYLFHTDIQDEEIFDMADMTLGCGRQSASLKLALSWIYYGKEGYEARINRAFKVAGYFAQKLSCHGQFNLISSNPPPCLQVCFYYTPHGSLSNDGGLNSKRTRTIVQQLIHEGFMVDYAPDVSRGDFFRAVVNSQTTTDTIDRLVEAILQHGKNGR